MQEHQKNVQLKVFTTYIRVSQIFLDQNRALSRSVQLEAVYLEVLLYIKVFMSTIKVVIPVSIALVHASEKISSHCLCSTGALILTMRVVLCSSSDNVFESSLSDFDRLPQLGHVSKTL